MKASKFRKQTVKELSDEIEKARKENEELRYNVRSRKEKDYSQVKEGRKNVAVMLTVLTEKLTSGEEGAKVVKDEADLKKEKTTVISAKNTAAAKSDLKETIKHQDKTLNKKTKDDK
ncbi:MAG: 50S ribosomal protein L29 [Patescibacteria group bacterium]|nr:50S ribosomal protein L29 [Patescibacteria group bacterium]